MFDRSMIITSNLNVDESINVSIMLAVECDLLRRLLLKLHLVACWHVLRNGFNVTKPVFYALID